MPGHDRSYKGGSRMKALKFTHSVIDLNSMNENSILIIKTDDPLHLTTEDLNPIINMIPKNTLIWIMSSKDSIETVSEGDMNEAGWFRK